MKLAPWIGVLALSLAACAAPPDRGAATRARIVDRCHEELDLLARRDGVPGVSLGLALPDGSRTGLTAGVADVESGQPLRPDHLLLAGSVGKLFVTAAAQRLVADGVLGLDDRAVDWLGDASWFARVPNHDTITLRQLLRHQTGIPRYVFAPEFAAALVEDPDHVWVAPERIAYVFDADPLFPAGDGWAYSDTNYLVVGLIVEAATGRDFYGWVEDQLLAPAGLGGGASGPGIVPSDRRDLPRMAQGHAVLGAGMIGGDRTLADGVFTVSPQFEWCGGGYATRPAALAAWTRRLMGGRAIDAPYLDAYLDGVPSPALGPGTRYGLGVILRDTDLGPTRGHSGFMPGYLTITEYFVDHDLAVTVQVNTDDARALGEPLTGLVERLAAIAVEELAAAG